MFRVARSGWRRNPPGEAKVIPLQPVGRGPISRTFWLDHDVVISSEGGAPGRKQFEIHVEGRPFANRPTLADAKAAVEERYGPLEWAVERQSGKVTEHAVFGPITEFTVWTASLP